MIHNILAVVFVLVTASFYDGIANELSEEVPFEFAGDADDDEIESKISCQPMRVSTFLITGCHQGDFSYDCNERRKWDNVLEKPDTLFDYFYVKDKKKLVSYLSRVIQEKVQYRQFTRWEKTVKHKKLRRLIARELIVFLRLLSNDMLKRIFKEEGQKSLLKYALRFVFYEKNAQTIDKVSLVCDVYHKLLFPSDKDTILDLSWMRDRQFQQLLMYAHELFQVFFKQDIQELMLYKNNLSAVPDFNIPSLRELWLFNNNIKNVPNFKLPHLTLLNLAFNNLIKVPMFDDLKQLKVLTLSHNWLKAIPSFTLPQLEQMAIDHNLIATLPAFKLPRLIRLNIHSNKPLKMTKEESDQLFYNCPNLDHVFY